MADRKRGIPNSPDKIFGVGSRPIDFTVAAIQLLAQQGKLKLDDPITRFFENVPEDKSAMTLRHLLTGQSGLPDFFDTEEDADPDLTWINRKTAEQRILNQQLLFAPGTSEAHSHGAFVFLSAVVERVSGKPYYSFIRENFLDPAGMTKTGEYGESRGLSVDDFAVGVGGSSVGIPNIPPNWGPTSWLIKGSGGMYSTLDDLRRFYKYVRSGKVLDTEHRRRFDSMSVNLDGSERGYELFSVYIPPDRELFIFFNELKDFDRLRRLFRELNQSLAPAGARMKKQTN